MPARRRALALAVAACAPALAVTGCGTSERDQVVAKVQQYVTATAHRDYRTLCRQVLAPALLVHLQSSGVSCEQGMQIALQNVHQPSLSIGRVVLHGRTASVTTITTAAGQEASLDAIELVRTRAGWRIDGLGTPQIPRRGSTSG